MLEDKPLVSILLPVYNRPNVIKTIDTVIKQTYKKIELIIVDNASTDSTVNEIRNIKDDRIKIYINEVNKGQTFSLNRGLTLCNGKYIARIDSDDLMMPTRIEKQVAFLESHPDYIICGSNVTIIDDYDNKIGTFSYCENDDAIRFYSTYFCPFAHPAVMMRTNIIIENGVKYDLAYSMAEDYDMWVRILQFGKGYNIQECLTQYRQGKSNDSVKYHNQMKHEGFQIMRYIANKCSWSNYSVDAYCRLIDSAEKPNKSMLENIYVMSKWIIYFKKNTKKQHIDYKIQKKGLMGFLRNSCIEDNERKDVKALYKIYKQLKKHKEV